MTLFHDLTGLKFGALKFIEFLGFVKKPTYQYALWKCQCDCGKFTEVSGRLVVAGKTASCGGPSHRSELSRKGWDRRGRKHSLSKHPLYNTWSGMIARCYKPQLKSYELYGAKGVRVCDEWINEPTQFIEYMLSIGWATGLTVDRIDSNGNYEPGNVRAADRIIQSNNTNRNRLLEFNGKTKTMAEWARAKGLDYGVLQTRIQRKWEVDRALNTPAHIYTKS